jgi:hypothetical protein
MLFVEIVSWNEIVVQIAVKTFNEFSIFYYICKFTDVTDSIVIFTIREI